MFPTRRGKPISARFPLGAGASGGRSSQEGQQIADGEMPVGRFWYRKMSLHVVAIPAAALLLDDVPGFREVIDYSERATLGDTHGRGDIPQPHARVAGDAQQHQCVVGQEAPVRHAGKLSHPFSGTLLLVSECGRGAVPGATAVAAADDPRSGSVGLGSCRVRCASHGGRSAAALRAGGHARPFESASGVP
jgi:hypothetical protein